MFPTICNPSLNFSECVTWVAGYGPERMKYTRPRQSELARRLTLDTQSGSHVVYNNTDLAVVPVPSGVILGYQIQGEASQ